MSRHSLVRGSSVLIFLRTNLFTLLGHLAQGIHRGHSVDEVFTQRHGDSTWAAPLGFLPGHNGGFLERMTEPALADHVKAKPHIVMVLWDDFGWASAGWHRDYTIGGVYVPASQEVRTPELDVLLRDGMELNRAYVYSECSPTRSAIQTGRSPPTVNVFNRIASSTNPGDPVTGFAGIPRNMTGIATKLAAAGYHTAYYGKWDAGMATADHTPDGRGYQQGVWYYNHENDYYTMSTKQQCSGRDITDLWVKARHDATGKPAHGYNGSCVGYHADVAFLDCPRGPHGAEWYNGYEDALFERHILEMLDGHDPLQPLFLFWAPHAVHAPLQVPPFFLKNFDFMAETDTPGKERQRHAAMVAFASRALGNVTQRLREKGMWDDTLFVFMSDNGGSIVDNGRVGGNNYPLKGGKYSNFEGGIRSNAFVAGGALHPKRRGTRFEGLVAAWDWYTTFSALAGVDPEDHRARVASLPPIDSVDLTKVIQQAPHKARGSPRLRMPISGAPRDSDLSNAGLCSDYEHAGLANSAADDPEKGATPRRCSTIAGVIEDDSHGLWKLITGRAAQYVTTGPSFPNRSGFLNSTDREYTANCQQGCLFELESDPLETQDLAPMLPEKVAGLRQWLEHYHASSLKARATLPDPKACEVALARYGGFWGPFMD